MVKLRPEKRDPGQAGLADFWDVSYSQRSNADHHQTVVDKLGIVDHPDEENPDKEKPNEEFVS